MAFANDGAVGGNGGTPASGGPEGVRTPLVTMRAGLIGGGHRHSDADDILSFPQQKTSEQEPGMVPNALRGFLAGMRGRFSGSGSGSGNGTAASLVRTGTLRTLEENNPNRLAGQYAYRHPDDDMTGLGIAGASSYPVEASGSTSTLQWGDGSDAVGEPIRHQSDGGAVDDITVQIQSRDSEEFLALRSLRASYPTLVVCPLPQTRSQVITAADTPIEVQLPEGAVLCRFTWSGMMAGCDIFVSVAGGATAPKIANPNAQALYDQAGILNPDFHSWFYTKGKRSVSVMMLSSGFVQANPCVFNVQAYCNN